MSTLVAFNKAVDELLNDYKKSIENGKSSYGIYWTEQDLVSDLMPRIKRLLKEKQNKIHLNVCINREFDYIANHGKDWLKKWRRKRFADIVILNGKIHNGDTGPFGLVAEVKLSYGKSGQRIDKQVKKQVMKDIERLKDLKKEGLCNEAVFFYLDEFHKTKAREEMRKTIEDECCGVIEGRYEGNPIIWET